MGVETITGGECDCGSVASIEAKQRVSGWTVYVVCPNCSLDERVGTVDMSDVSSVDERYQAFEELASEVLSE